MKNERQDSQQLSKACW